MPGRLACSVALALTALATFSPAEGIVRVFVLAGQSNMAGWVDNELLDLQATDPKTGPFFAHLRTGDAWTVRDDVFIKTPLAHGKLTPGFGTFGKTGPELEFGHVVGEFFEEPVLLIKTAWGGDTLFKEFRSPSSGLPSEEALARELERVRKIAEGARWHRPLPTMEDLKDEFGSAYRRMIAQVHQTTANPGRLFPELEGKTADITGFVWFHGLNDMLGLDAPAEYSGNMERFIRDVCREFGKPHLPFVIAALGTNGSSSPSSKMAIIQKAQLAMNDVHDFRWNVIAFRTDELVDKDAENLFPMREEKPDEWRKTATERAFRYYGSPIWYTRIGHDMGVIMVELLR